MDQLRGLAIVLVVLFHARTVLRRFEPDLPPLLGELLSAFAPFRMPLLIFLSGMLLERSLTKPRGEFVRGKLRLIAWPYLVWSVLFLLVAERADPQNLVRILWDAPPHLWYLQHLVLYYLGALALRAVHVPLWVGGAAAYAASYAFEGTGSERFLLMFTFFVAGHLWVQHSHRVQPLTRGGWLLGAGTVAAVGAALSALGADLKYEPEWAWVSLAGIVVCLGLAPRLGENRATRALGYVGRESLVFYTSHFVVLWLLGRVLEAGGVGFPLGKYALGVGVALGAGAALAHLKNHSVVAAALFEAPRRG